MVDRVPKQGANKLSTSGPNGFARDVAAKLMEAANGSTTMNREQLCTIFRRIDSPKMTPGMVSVLLDAAGYAGNEQIPIQAFIEWCCVGQQNGSVMETSPMDVVLAGQQELTKKIASLQERLEAVERALASGNGPFALEVESDAPAKPFTPSCPMITLPDEQSNCIKEKHPSKMVCRGNLDIKCDLNPSGAGMETAGILNQSVPAKSYDQAFDEIGGQEALMTLSELSHTLQAQLTDATLESELASILPSDYRKRVGYSTKLVYQPFAPTLEDLFSKAQSALEEFREKVEGLAAATGGHAEVAGLKSNTRSRRKASFKYKDRNNVNGIAWYRLTDLCRATIIYTDIRAMYNGFQEIVYALGRNDILEFNDRYQIPMPGGYRDLQLVIRVNGHICELQLNTGAMVVAKETSGHRAFDVARELISLIEEGDWQGCRETLEWGERHVGSSANLLDVLSMDIKNGRTVLHESASRGMAEMVYYFLQRDVDPNCQDNAGDTPLHLAAQEGHERAVWALISCGRIDYNILNNDAHTALLKGFTALRKWPQEQVARTVNVLARSAGAAHVQKVRRLLDTHLKELMTNSTKLVHLAADGDVLGLTEELHNFAKPDSKDRLGVTALAAAAEQGHLSVVQRLLDYSASPGLEVQRGDAFSSNAISLAVLAGHGSVVRALLHAAGPADIEPMSSALIRTVHVSALKKMSVCSDAALSEMFKAQKVTVTIKNSVLDGSVLDGAEETMAFPCQRLQAGVYAGFQCGDKPQTERPPIAMRLFVAGEKDDMDLVAGVWTEFPTCDDCEGQLRSSITSSFEGHFDHLAGLLTVYVNHGRQIWPYVFLLLSDGSLVGNGFNKVASVGSSFSQAAGNARNKLNDLVFPSSEFLPEDPIGMPLIIVKKGALNQCIFREARELESGKMASLTLESHMGAGEYKSAAIGKYFQGKCDIEEHDTKLVCCLDEEGCRVRRDDSNFINLLDSKLSLCVGDRTARVGVHVIAASEGSKWIVNVDGTVALEQNPQLVLGTALRDSFNNAPCKLPTAFILSHVMQSTWMRHFLSYIHGSIAGYYADDDNKLVSITQTGCAVTIASCREKHIGTVVGNALNVPGWALGGVLPNGDIQFADGSLWSKCKQGHPLYTPVPSRPDIGSGWELYLYAGSDWNNVVATKQLMYPSNAEGVGQLVPHPTCGVAKMPHAEFAKRKFTEVLAVDGVGTWAHCKKVDDTVITVEEAFGVQRGGFHVMFNDGHTFKTVVGPAARGVKQVGDAIVGACGGPIMDDEDSSGRSGNFMLIARHDESGMILDVTHQDRGGVTSNHAVLTNEIEWQRDRASVLPGHLDYQDPGVDHYDYSSGNGLSIWAWYGRACRHGTSTNAPNIVVPLDGIWTEEGCADMSKAVRIYGTTLIAPMLGTMSFTEFAESLGNITDDWNRGSSSDTQDQIAFANGAVYRRQADACSMVSYGLTVSCAGTVEANGVWEPPKIYKNNRPLFARGDWNIWYDGQRWLIEKASTSGCKYTNPSSAAEPPSSGWEVAGGEFPVPLISNGGIVMDC